MIEHDLTESPGPAPPAEPQGRRGWSRLWREWVRPFALVVLIMMAFRSAVADWNDVPTGSMIPSILVGDRIFVNKLAYDLKIPFTTRRIAVWAHPRRSDVVVLLSPTDGRRLVKRVLGLPGDEIELRAHRLLVNGVPARYQGLDPGAITGLNGDAEGQLYTEILGSDSHPIQVLPWRPEQDFGPVRVPEDEYFVLGDNRDNSQDSRTFGFVHRSLIVGRAVGVAFSHDRFQPRWSRCFRALP